MEIICLWRAQHSDDGDDDIEEAFYCLLNNDESVIKVKMLVFLTVYS